MLCECDGDILLIRFDGHWVMSSLFLGGAFCFLAIHGLMEEARGATGRSPLVQNMAFSTFRVIHELLVLRKKPQN